MSKKLGNFVVVVVESYKKKNLTLSHLDTDRRKKEKGSRDGGATQNNGDTRTLLGGNPVHPTVGAKTKQTPLKWSLKILPWSTNHARHHMEHHGVQTPSLGAVYLRQRTGSL